jgi:hypothetical protein
VKERQDSIAARIAGTIAGGVRRRQQDRTPRALVYDASGEPRIVPAGSDEQAKLIETAEILVGLALDDPAGDGGDEPGAPDAPEGPAAADAPDGPGDAPAPESDAAESAPGGGGDEPHDPAAGDSAAE